MTGNPCLFCGTTRAIIEFFKFNFSYSIQINKFGIISIVFYSLLLFQYSVYFFIRNNIIRYQIYIIIINIIICFILFIILYNF